MMFKYFSRKERKVRKIKRGLRVLARGGVPRNTRLGVCDYLLKVHDTYIDSDKFKDYPLNKSFSGAYPVPHPTEHPAVGFNEESDLWVGEYGDSRRAFCEWLADNITSEWV